MFLGMCGPSLASGNPMYPPGVLLDAARGQGITGTKVSAQGIWVVVNPFLPAALL